MDSNTSTLADRCTHPISLWGKWCYLKFYEKVQSIWIMSPLNRYLAHRTSLGAFILTMIQFWRGIGRVSFRQSQGEKTILFYINGPVIDKYALIYWLYVISSLHPWFEDHVLINQRYCIAIPFTNRTALNEFIYNDL